ncbi:MAG: hypothetical protein WCH46_08555 [bacterium]
MKGYKAVLNLCVQFLPILVVAYACIAIAFYAIPHLPISNKRTFHAMLRAQITLDQEKENQSRANATHHLLLLGSSVVERGINQSYLDSSFGELHLNLYATNAGAGGFFANSNLIMFRALLEHGLRPDRVVYGVFLQELNGKSIIHASVTDDDSTDIQIKSKSLSNVIRYGPNSLSSILDGQNFHIYLFALNHAFNDVHNPNFFQRLSFGENMFERDSSYRLEQSYLKDLNAIYELCKKYHIPFAFFNAPVRPQVESLADMPYLHKSEAYLAVQRIAEQNRIPIWNFDNSTLFSDAEFLDSYHLNANGAHKMTQLLADKIAKWNSGIIEQDVLANSTDSVRYEVKGSLLRTAFHF